MKFGRWDPFQELVPVSYRPNRTANPYYPHRIEDSFGPWPVDPLSRQDLQFETAKPKSVEIKTA